MMGELVSSGLAELQKACAIVVIGFPILTNFKFVTGPASCTSVLYNPNPTLQYSETLYKHPKKGMLTHTPGPIADQG